MYQVHAEWAKSNLTTEACEPMRVSVEQKMKLRAGLYRQAHNFETSEMYTFRRFMI